MEKNILKINDYKKRRRQITSFPKVEIIETNSKYLEINSF